AEHASGVRVTRSRPAIAMSRAFRPSCYVLFEPLEHRCHDLAHSPGVADRIGAARRALVLRTVLGTGVAAKPVAGSSAEAGDDPIGVEGLFAVAGVGSPPRDLRVMSWRSPRPGAFAARRWPIACGRTRAA